MGWWQLGACFVIVEQEQQRVVTLAEWYLGLSHSKGLENQFIAAECQIGMYGFVLIAEWAWAIYSMAKLELSSHQEVACDQPGYCILEQVAVFWLEKTSWTRSNCMVSSWCEAWQISSSVVSVMNVSFEQTNLLSERSERNHSWTDLFLSQFSWAQLWACLPGVGLPPLTQRTVTEDVILVHLLCWKWRCVTHSLRAEELIHVQ